MDDTVNSDWLLPPLYEVNALGAVLSSVMAVAPLVDGCMMVLVGLWQ